MSKIQTHFYLICRKTSTLYNSIIDYIIEKIFMDNGGFGLVSMIGFNKEEISEIKRKSWIDGIIFDCLGFTNDEMEYFLNTLGKRIDEEIFTVKNELDELLKIKSVVDIKIK